MTLTSKHALAFLAAVTLVLPSVAIAREDARKNADEVSTNTAVCTRLASATGELTGKVTDLRSEWNDRKTDRLEKFKTGKDTADNKLDAARHREDAKRDQAIAKLKEKYTGTEQLAAITAFETTIGAAVTTRRSVVDAAVKAYRDGISSLLQSRQTGMATALTTFKTSVQAGIDTAKADCAAGQDTQTIKTTLTTSLKNARQKFQSDRRAVDKVQPQIEQLKQTRNKAVQKALSDFRATAQEARETLKGALGENEEQE